MSLNIKNERVHALAREAARCTGQSQTSVIEEALTRLLEQVRECQTETGVDRARDVAADFARRLSIEDRRRLTTEDLYDDRGLPA
jgi:antitoxin VapB